MGTSDNSALSVLDEIRATIASLDELRRNDATSVAVSAPEEPVLPEPEDSLVPAIDRPTDPGLRRDTESPARPSPAVPVADDSSPVAATPLPALTAITGGDSASVVPSLSSSSQMSVVLGKDTLRARTADKDSRIMIVDDEPLNIMTFRQHLKMEGYTNFITTENAREVIDLMRDENPDVLLLDIRMPEVNGLELLQVIALDPVLQHTPVLVLTAATDPRIKRKALDLGAYDFLSKPIDPSELLPRVRNAIVLKQHYDLIADEAARLEREVDRRTRQLEATRRQLIVSLARAAEHRDNDTGNHVLRVGRYAVVIAREMGYPEAGLSDLELAAQLHDVGKIGIPDHILFKSDKLSPDEYELMKKHCLLGRQIIEPFSGRDWEVLRSHADRGYHLLQTEGAPLLNLAARIAQSHHEHWDGSGYPLGLAGEDIPLEGRIVAVADVFDALSSHRSYKKAYPRERCFEIIREGSGAHFDPTVVAALERCSDEITAIQVRLMDEAGRLTGPGMAIPDEHGVGTDD